MPYENEHACRKNSPEKYDKFRRGKRKHAGKEYSIIFGKLKNSNKWEEQAYRYNRETWTVEAAHKHCKDHDGTFEAAAKEQKQEEFKCECIKCGHKMVSDKHCTELKCEKCGGKMRRQERPGPGKDLENNKTQEQLDKILKEFPFVKETLLQLQLDVESLTEEDPEDIFSLGNGVEDIEQEPEHIIALDDEEVEQQILTLDEDEVDVDGLTSEEVKDVVISTLKSELGRLD